MKRLFMETLLLLGTLVVLIIVAVIMVGSALL